MKLVTFLVFFFWLSRNIVKTQKGLSSDIARGSVKPLHKVQEDTESLKQMLAGLTSGLQRNGALADKLKADTAKVMRGFALLCTWEKFGWLYVLLPALYLCMWHFKFLLCSLHIILIASSSLLQNILVYHLFGSSYLYLYFNDSILYLLWQL